MERLFTNDVILSWLKYFADNTPVDLARVRIIDITRKNKNLIPTVQSHRSTVVFTDAGDMEIFYRMWDAGLGDCVIWYNEGSDPSGPIKHDKLSDMIDRGINASAGMLIFNPNSRYTYRIGMSNDNFSVGSIQFVAPEVRAVILNKMNVEMHDNIVSISGESIAIEASLIASQGSVLAIEYSPADRATLEENITHFGVRNIMIEDHLDEEVMKKYPVPSMVFMVPSPKMEQELECLAKINPNIYVVVYTLDFRDAANIGKVFEKCGIGDMQAIQVAVSKLKKKNYNFVQEPAPWIFTGRAGGK